MSVNRELEKKVFEYMSYLKRHISGVQIAYYQFCTPLLERSNLSTLFSDEELHQAVLELRPIIRNHDESKYSSVEFEGYRMHYYPTQFERESIDFDSKQRYAFDLAWDHHWKHNPHHINYWYMRQEKMPLKFMLEMICDWVSVGNLKGTSTLAWYSKDALKEKRMLGDQCFDVESLMGHTLCIER